MTNKEFNESFRNRTKKFAVAIIKFIEKIPFNSATRTLTYQLGKSGTSLASNFRAFCLARSRNERFAKICIVVEETDESVFWLIMFDETGYGDKNELKYLLTEGMEILKVTNKIKQRLYPAMKQTEVSTRGSDFLN